MRHENSNPSDMFHSSTPPNNPWIPFPFPSSHKFLSPAVFLFLYFVQGLKYRSGRVKVIGRNWNEIRGAEWWNTFLFLVGWEFTHPRPGMGDVRGLNRRKSPRQRSTITNRLRRQAFKGKEDVTLFISMKTGRLHFLCLVRKEGTMERKVWVRAWVLSKKDTKEEGKYPLNHPPWFLKVKLGFLLFIITSFITQARRKEKGSSLPGPYMSLPGESMKGGKEEKLIMVIAN